MEKNPMETSFMGGFELRRRQFWSVVCYNYHKERIPVPTIILCIYVNATSTFPCGNAYVEVKW
mgnify:CR=1 FL=1